jgi:hypothetical protein
MVTRYTEEELISYKAGACLPDGVDLSPFLNLVATVTEFLRQLEEQNPHRRKSFTHHKLTRKAKQPKEIIDEDGWTSFIPKKAHEDDEKEESAIVEEENDDFEIPVKKGKQHTIKIKTNASKISSGKSSVADARDSVVITQVSKFNAFDALLTDEEE